LKSDSSIFDQNQVQQLIEIMLSIPEIPQPLSIRGKVTSSSEIEPGKWETTLVFDAGENEKISILERVLKKHETYSPMLASSPQATPHPEGPRHMVRNDAAERIKDLRHIIGNRDTVERISKETEKPPPPPIISKDRIKNEFTSEERDRMVPVATVVLSLTKAMLRSGYYAPEHPENKKAKEGIYNDFKKAVGGDRFDITLIAHETKQRFDVLIAGVLDDYVSLRGLIGIEQAEIFVPKMKEYFGRKNLVSFSIKRDIPLMQFEDFIDVMSDPTREQISGKEVGSLLTSALVEKGITEVSTLFMNDIIVLGYKLPWRVEMAIQRLAKDLKVLPLFKDKTKEQIQTIKGRIVRDIIRPLREPHMLKDIVTNAYIISKHVPVMNAGELEETIVLSFPMQIIVPTSYLIFEELSKIKKDLEDNPGHAGLTERYKAIKRILGWIYQRTVAEKIPTASEHITQLYYQDIVKFEELPSQIQDHVNTIKLAKDFKENFSSYVMSFIESPNENDVLLFLRLFRRILPVFLDEKNLDLISVITSAVIEKFELQPHLKKSVLDPLNDPIKFIWEDSTESLISHFETEKGDERNILDRIVKMLGPYGVDLLINVLMESQNKFVRRAAINILVNLKEYSIDAMTRILKNPTNPWYLYRNALFVLSRIGRHSESSLIASFINHPNPRIREEALGTLTTIEGSRVASQILRALKDPDIAVRQRAVICAGQVPLLSPEAVSVLIAILEEADGKTEQEKESLTKLKIEAINTLAAIGNMAGLDNRRVESILVDVLLDGTSLIDKLFKPIRFKKRRYGEDSIIKVAALKGLWKIGSPTSIPGLKRFMRKGDKSLAAKVKDTIREIELRREPPGVASNPQQR